MIAAPNHFIVFDGQNLGDWGLHISGDKTFGAPERDVDEVEVPGRDGTLTYDKGRFKNYTLEYDGGIVCDDERSLEVMLGKLRSYLCSRVGYKRLEDTYHPEEFRLAKFVGGLDPDVVLLLGGTFTLEFDCKPQRFLKTGEKVTTLTASGSLYNLTDYNAKPLLRIYGNGSVEIGGYKVTISNKPSSYDYIDVDSDIMDCEYDSINCNEYVALQSEEFPMLEPGLNNIVLGSGISKVEITPRWYTI